MRGLPFIIKTEVFAGARPLIFAGGTALTGLCRVDKVLCRVIRPLSGVLLSLVFVSLFLISPARGGEYHNSTTKGASTETLACGQCHSMHGTQGGQSMIYDGAAIPYPKLLRHSTILNLCLYCHDGNQAGLSPPPPDVWGTLAAGQSNPSAGNLCSGGGAAPCTDVTTNHSVGVDVSTTEPPGFVGTWSNVTDRYTTIFNCIYCHDQHGNANYRNLRTNPGSASGVVVSYSMGPSGDGAKHVNNLVSPGLGVAKYETDVVVFRLPPSNTDTDGIQAFCKGCHTNFHFGGGENSTEMGGPEPTSPWKRHPTKDTRIDTSAGTSNAHTDLNCWQSGSSNDCQEPFTTPNRVIDPDGITRNGDEIPFCLSCHRAHGSTRHSNLIFGEPTSTGGAGTMMRSTCQQCHNQ